MDHNIIQRYNTLTDYNQNIVNIIIKYLNNNETLTLDEIDIIQSVGFILFSEMVKSKIE